MLSFLDLPTELRFQVHGYFTPEDQSAEWHGKPLYDGLLRSSKQIRNEAPSEIRKAAIQYYKELERKWLE